MISPPYSLMIKSCNNKTQPPKVMMAGLGGLGNDLTSIK